jgi:WD40 repeat protein
VLENYPEEVLCTAISTGGKHIACAAKDATIWIWRTDIDTGLHNCSLPQKTQQTAVVTSLDFSEDNTLLATGDSANTVTLWKLDDGSDEASTEIKPFKIGDSSYEVLAVRFSPDAQKFATSSSSYKIATWDVQTGKSLRTCSLHTSPAMSIAWSPDSKLFTSGGVRDKLFYVWDAYGRLPPVEIHDAGGLTCAAFARKTALIFSAGHGGIVTARQLQESREAGVRAVMRGHGASVWDIVLSPDDRRVATCSLEDQTVRVWETDTGLLITVLDRFLQCLRGVMWADDARLLTIAGVAGSATVVFFDVQVCVLICVCMYAYMYVMGVCTSHAP